MQIEIGLSYDEALALPVPHLLDSGQRRPAWSFRSRFGKAFRTILHACRGCWRTRSSLVAPRARSVWARPPAASGLPEGFGGGGGSLPLPTRGGAQQRLAEPVPLPRGVPEKVGAALKLVTGHEHRLECWRTSICMVPVRWQAVIPNLLFNNLFCGSCSSPVTIDAISVGELHSQSQPFRQAS